MVVIRCNYGFLFSRKGRSYLLNCRSFHSLHAAFVEACTRERGCTLIFTIAKSIRARLVVFILRSLGLSFPFRYPNAWEGGFRRLLLTVTRRERYLEQTRRFGPIYESWVMAPSWYCQLKGNVNHGRCARQGGHRIPIVERSRADTRWNAVFDF